MTAGRVARPAGDQAPAAASSGRGQGTSGSSPIAAALDNFAAQPNVRLWFSLDRDTGEPLDVPQGVRLAFLAALPEDVPPHEADLVFRPRSQRAERPTTFSLNVLCPNERPDHEGLTCSACQRCGR